MKSVKNANRAKSAKSAKSRGRATPSPDNGSGAHAGTVEAGMSACDLRAASPVWLMPLIFWVLVLSSCNAPLTILSYNVQNLFDEHVDGTEYHDYLPESGWDDRAVDRKLEAIARVLMDTRFPGPDIVLLQEVENAAVLQRLSRDYLPLSAYRYAIHAGGPGSATGCAILSRRAPDRILIHRPQDQLRAGARLQHARAPRYVMEARFRDVIPGENGADAWIHIFVVHLKSRRGDAAYGAATRRAAMDIVALRTARIRADGGRNALIMVAGDFNTTDPLSLLQESGPEADAGAAWKVLTDPSNPGTYVYGGSWYRYDHFLVSLPGGAQRAPVQTRYVNHEWMLSRRGHPLGFDAERLHGVSDHLPVLLTLQDAGP